MNRLGSMGRTLHIYVVLTLQNFKAQASFRADFTFLVASSAVTQLLGVVFLRVLYHRIPSINGWNFWEVVFIYAMIFFTEGITSLLFEGCWNFSFLVNGADLDRMLLRPLSPILQIVSSKVGLHGIGNIGIGGILIFQSIASAHIRWSVLTSLAVAILLVSAVAIRGSIILGSNSSAFWLKGPSNSLGMMVHNIAEFAKYPITMFTLPVQVLVVAIIPYAFIGFFPAAFIFNKGDVLRLLGLCSPLVAVYCVMAARAIFYLGLNKYESAGN